MGCKKHKEDQCIKASKGLKMSGAQEVPAKETAASGTLDVSYNKCDKMLTFTVTFKKLTAEPIGSHIHGTAPKGVNAPVKYNFTPLIPKATSGTVTNSVLVDGTTIKEDSLLMGYYYINIHTPKNPGGEIRGQIEF
jgi:hypothetical protein